MPNNKEKRRNIGQDVSNSKSSVSEILRPESCKGEEEKVIQTEGTFQVLGVNCGCEPAAYHIAASTGNNFIPTTYLYLPPFPSTSTPTHHPISQHLQDMPTSPPSSSSRGGLCFQMTACHAGRINLASRSNEVLAPELSQAPLATEPHCFIE